MIVNGYGLQSRLLTGRPNQAGTLVDKVSPSTKSPAVLFCLSKAKNPATKAPVPSSEQSLTGNLHRTIINKLWSPIVALCIGPCDHVPVQIPGGLFKGFF